ncbi:arylesterase [Leeuwenhoekiella sp. A16]|uniref:arylesterase n=1 Tax=Leeuwenhoekiella sp. A16 TaxID=3141462 RepID=UPI003A801A7B
MRTFYIYFTFLILSIFISCGDKPKDANNDEELQNTESTTEPEKTNNSNTILVFGDSLTAGYGLDPNDAFSAVLQAKLDSLGYDYNVVNAGLSGETTASGKNRISWVLKQNVDIFILELGANDGLRGIPLDETRTNLQAIIDTVRNKDPETKIVLAGMQIPPNMGQEYTTDFKQIFPDLAAKNDVFLIPFLLENVAGIPSLNQADGIHPTVEGHKIVAENVWEVINPLLEK